MRVILIFCLSFSISSFAQVQKIDNDSLFARIILNSNINLINLNKDSLSINNKNLKVNLSKKDARTLGKIVLKSVFKFSTFFKNYPYKSILIGKYWIIWGSEGKLGDHGRNLWIIINKDSAKVEAFGY